MPYDPKHTEHETHLRSLIRRGTINFDAVVEELKVSGYIDETHDAIKVMTRPGFNGFDSEEFEILFRFFYPGRDYNMEVLKYGVPMGASGHFVYALYDSQQITRDELTQAVKVSLQSRA